MFSNTRTRVRPTFSLPALGAATASFALFGTIATTSLPDSGATAAGEPKSTLAGKLSQGDVFDGAVAKGKAKAKKVTADDVISLAKKQVGIKEKGGSTKFNDWYADSARAKETLARDGGGSAKIYRNAAWCSMFISWLGEQVGFRHQVGWDAWTVKHASWFKGNDRWGTKPKPGAVVFFDWDGGKSIDGIDHVGLVTKTGNGSIETIEGNSENEVQVRKRTSGTIVGYGYPTYATK